MRLIRFLFSAGKEWERVITSGNYSFFFVLCVSLLPLLALCCFGEGLLIMKLGENRGEFGRITIPPEQILKYELFYASATLFAIFLGSFVLKLIGESFDVTAAFSAYFALLAYAFSPIILTRVLDGLPFMNTWVCYAIGAALAVSIVYHGVAFALKPEQTKGFGILLLNQMYVLMASAAVHFAATQVLQGRLVR